MKSILTQKSITVPENVSVSIRARRVVVKGPRGTLVRSFKASRLTIKMLDDKVQVSVWHGSKKLNAQVKTIMTHISNMINGVTKGFQYKMRLVYSHFPINSVIEDGERQRIKIRNFLGEKNVRDIEMAEGVKIRKSENVKDELVLEGNCLDSVSQSAASIQQSVLVHNKDVRKFLDGIYVSEKGFLENDE